jgi:hypothetical protein
MRTEKVLRVDSDYVFATWDRVLLHVWTGQATSVAVRELRRIAAAFIKEATHPICCVSTVEPSSPPPTDNVRKELSALYAELTRDSAHSLVIAEGGGFRGAIIRGVGLTLSALAPQKLPFKFVSSIHEASTIIEPHLSPTSGGAAGARAMIDRVRAKAIQAHGVSEHPMTG